MMATIKRERAGIRYWYKTNIDTTAVNPSTCKDYEVMARRNLG